jgi:endonuclease YncB( thermonuclease family)
MSLARRLAVSGPTVVVLAGLVLVAGCQRKPEPPLAAAPPASITGHVRVMDADALIVDGKHVRLANAYAPESLLHARCWAESLASDHAARYVRDLVDHARTFEFTPNGKTDEYNRAVGNLSLDGADLGDILYAQGLAARPVEPRFDWCQPISKQADGAPNISSLYSQN